MQELVCPYAAVVVGIIEIEIYRGENTAPHAGLGNQQVDLAACGELTLNDKFGHINPGAVRVDPVADEETIEDVQKIVTVQELADAAGIVAKSKICRCRDSAADLRRYDGKGWNRKTLLVGEFHDKRRRIKEKEVDVLAHEQIENGQGLRDNGKFQLALALKSSTFGELARAFGLAVELVSDLFSTHGIIGLNEVADPAAVYGATIRVSRLGGPYVDVEATQIYPGVRSQVFGQAVDKVIDQLHSIQKSRDI